MAPVLTTHYPPLDAVKYAQFLRFTAGSSDPKSDHGVVVDVYTGVIVYPVFATNKKVEDILRIIVPMSGTSGYAVQPYQAEVGQTTAIAHAAPASYDNIGMAGKEAVVAVDYAQASIQLQQFLHLRGVAAFTESLLVLDVTVGLEEVNLQRIAYQVTVRTTDTLSGLAAAVNTIPTPNHVLPPNATAT
jgi:hypothetical protein